jgi:hypothetical protein
MPGILTRFKGASGSFAAKIEIDSDKILSPTVFLAVT